MAASLLFPEDVIQIIEDCANWADRLTRADLAAGLLVSENDYTSNFTSALRREIHARNIPGLRARIQVLFPLAERSNGADGCIILSNTSEFKVGLFEAKWPRLSAHTNAWDSIQRSSRVSHFDDQLARQKFAAKTAAVWEMFYSEYEPSLQPDFMPNDGSACVWHDDAIAASGLRNQSKPWTDVELEELLRGKSQTVGQVVRDICECKRGKPIPEGDYAQVLSNFAPPAMAVVVTYQGRI